MIIARLNIEAREIDRAAVDTDRGTRFKSVDEEAKRAKIVGEAESRRLGDAATGGGEVTDEDAAIEESAIGEDYGGGGDRDAEASGDTLDSAVRSDDSDDLVLPERQMRCRLKYREPRAREESLVALGAGAPHSWTFGAVEHTELNS